MRLLNRSSLFSASNHGETVDQFAGSTKLNSDSKFVYNSLSLMNYLFLMLSATLSINCDLDNLRVFLFEMNETIL
jgi:hypothetical protein